MAITAAIAIRIGTSGDEPSLELELESLFGPLPTERAMASFLALAAAPGLLSPWPGLPWFVPPPFLPVAPGPAFSSSDELLSDAPEFCESP